MRSEWWGIPKRLWALYVLFGAACWFLGLLTGISCSVLLLQ